MNRLARPCILVALVIAVALAWAAPAFAAPGILFAKYTNPIAYELKSLQSTRFYTRVDTANVWAALKVRTPYGDKYIYRGAIPTAGTNFYFPLWDGKGPSGQRLPTSVAYRWSLTVTRGGQSTTASGTIPVTRIYTSISGSVSQSYFDNFELFTHTYHSYFVKGWVTAYLSARATASAAFTPNPGEVRLNVFATGFIHELYRTRTLHINDGTFAYGKGTFPYPVISSQVPLDYWITLVE